MMENIMVALVRGRSASQVRGLDDILLAMLDLIRRTAVVAAHEIRMRHDLVKLQSFDDTMLHDIGLSRSEIEYVVRHGRPAEDWTEWR
jgi:uncharacterized protein YjiS (DUF1127 family)